MWVVNGHELRMTEGDYGVELPITVSGTELGSTDTIQIIIKDRMNGTVIVSKSYEGIENNTVPFELTESESALLQVGIYTYCLDWYQASVFMCNIIPNAVFRVVDKA